MIAELKKEFGEWVTSDAETRRLWQLARDNKSDYAAADKYAERVAAKWSEMLTREFGDDYAAFEQEIKDAYRKAYSETAYYSKTVQAGINKNAKIGMRAMEPAIDEERVAHLAKRLSEDDAGFLLGESALESATRTAVADTIKMNARIQSKAGLHAYITRDPGAGCCTWCNSMAGTYEYGNEPSDFWRVHAGCTCNFIYKPSKTERIITRFNTTYSTGADGKKKATISKVTE